MKQSTTNNNEKQLKARVQNIEKSYETLKMKCTQLEDENKNLIEQNKKLEEAAIKQK